MESKCLSLNFRLIFSFQPNLKIKETMFETTRVSSKVLLYTSYRVMRVVLNSFSLESNVLS